MARRKKEGRLVKTRPPMDVVASFIMPNRNGSCNYFGESIEITECEKYIKRKREEGLAGFGMLHLFIAAYIRTISQRPALNRFLSGQRTYQRNDIEISLTIKKELALNAPETVIKLSAKRDFTADDVYHQLKKIVDENKQDDMNNGMDKVAGALAKLPPLILKFAVAFLRFLDYFGWLPRSLTYVSPFHCSMFITSMGSLGISPIFHHLYDFGNCPVFVSTGKKYKQAVLRKDGTVEEHKYMDMRCVLDERICDGHYYASSFKYLLSIMQKPDQLDNPPENIVEDIK